MGWIKRGILHFINNTGIQRKLNVMFFALILIPMVLLTVVITLNSQRTIQQGILKNESITLREAQASLSQSLSEVVHYSNLIIQDQQFHSYVDALKQSGSYFSYILYSREIDKIYQRYQLSPLVYRTRLYIDSDIPLVDQRIDFFSINEAAARSWYPSVLARYGKILWTPAEEFRYAGIDDTVLILSAVRTTRVADSDGRPDILAIDIPSDSVSTLLGRYNSQEGLMLITDGGGADVLTGSSEAVHMGRLYLDAGDGDWYSVTYRGLPYLAASLPLQYTQWNIVKLLPADATRRALMPIWLLSAALTAAVGGLAFVLASVVSRSITGRIDGLIREINAAEIGRIPQDPIVGGDEVALLQRSYRDMFRRVSTLMNEKYAMGINLQKAELNALQAQVNPHFLYNTLDAISWKARKQQAHEIDELVSALSRYYRIGLSKGRTVISISEEITHAELYFNIQSLRFKNRFTLQKDVDETIVDYDILKNVLQPLVENAILHGLMEKQPMGGTVRISGRMDAETILMTVEDDGVGMGSDRLDRLLTTGSREGYGVYNVNQRLITYYGPGCGLSYESAPGRGTVVTLRIPVVRPSDRG